MFLVAYKKGFFEKTAFLLGLGAGARGLAGKAITSAVSKSLPHEETLQPGKHLAVRDTKVAIPPELYKKLLELGLLDDVEEALEGD